jgi:hypothetical protein
VPNEGTLIAQDKRPILLLQAIQLFPVTSMALQASAPVICGVNFGFERPHGGQRNRVGKVALCGRCNGQELEAGTTSSHRRRRNSAGAGSAGSHPFGLYRIHVVSLQHFTIFCKNETPAVDAGAVSPVKMRNSPPDGFYGAMEMG